MLIKRLLGVLFTIVAFHPTAGISESFLACEKKQNVNSEDSTNFTPASDTQWKNSVNRIIHSLVGDDAKAFLGFNPSIKIVESSIPNASIDSNELRISTALIHMTKDESELAFVVAHEISHVALNHLRPVYFGASSEKLSEEIEADRAAGMLIMRAGFDEHAGTRILDRLSNLYLVYRSGLSHSFSTRSTKLKLFILS